MSVRPNDEIMRFLPHQHDLITDTETKILGLVSGFGGGKTYSAARKHVHLCTLNGATDSIFTEPNFPLLTQIAIPELETALKEFHQGYTFNKGEGIFYLDSGARIICKSMETWERLIGVNASHITMDEFDVGSPALGIKAFQKLLGRIRAGTNRPAAVW